MARLARRGAALDAAALEAARVETVACEHAHALAGPFTSGRIARQSFERVLPNTLIEPTAADHYSAEERRGRLVPDRHPDEHATCYVVEGRGLVVISSCGHCGLINTIRTAMAVANVGKLHAVIGGFQSRRRTARLRRAHDRRAEGARSRCRLADALQRPGLPRWD